MRIRTNQREYKIRWKDSPGSTWEPRENLTNCPRLLYQFESRLGLRGPMPRSKRKDARVHLPLPPR